MVPTEAVTEHEDNSEYDVVWNIEKSSLINNNEINLWSELQNIWKRLFFQSMIDLYKRNLYR